MVVPTDIVTEVVPVVTVTVAVMMRTLPFILEVNQTIFWLNMNQDTVQIVAIVEEPSGKDNPDLVQ